MIKRLAKAVWLPAVGVFLCIVSLFLWTQVETISLFSGVLIALVMVALVINLMGLVCAVVYTELEEVLL